MKKFIKDPIYDDYLEFSDVDLKFIDNKAFKRLKNIKQLECLDHVFSATIQDSVILGVALG